MRRNATAVVFVTMPLILMTLACSSPAVTDSAASGEEIKTMGPGYGSQVPIPRLSLGQADDYMKLLYDALVGENPDGTLSTENGLAEQWERSEDALTWTFHIRKGVTFHNGDALTSKDVEFSIWQTTEPDSKSGYSDFIKQTIQSIDTPDPYTVVIHLNNPSLYLDRYFTGQLAMVIPQDYYERVGLDEFVKHPIGSGPYKWHSQSIGSFIKLEATDHHWQIGVPRFRYMTYLIVPEESTRIAMLETGEGDISEVSRSRVGELEDKGFRILLKKNDALLQVNAEMQWTSPAFQDIRFRKALDLAIDKASIRRNIFQGMAEPAAGYPGSEIALCGGDATLEPRPYDPVEAKRLVEEAGLVGYEFTVPNMKRDGAPELSQVVEAVVGYWQAVGLKPTIRNTTWEAYRAEKRNGKIPNYVQVIEDGASTSCKSLLHELAIRYYSKYNPSARIKAENYPELSALFEEALNATAEDDVPPLVGKIYRYLYDNWLSAAICELDLPVAISGKVPMWDVGVAKAHKNYRDLVWQR
jgi:peptide/nickel transport system substrate-binding protein